VSATRQPALADQIADAARLHGRRGGRPRGSYSPLGIWLRGVIREMRRGGHGCADTWRRLCLAEDQGSKPKSFRVSAETADDVWQDVGADIRGREVSWSAFEKLWQRM